MYVKRPSEIWSWFCGDWSEFTIVSDELAKSNQQSQYATLSEAQLLQLCLSRPYEVLLECFVRAKSQNTEDISKVVKSAADNIKNKLRQTDTEEEVYAVTNEFSDYLTTNIDYSNGPDEAIDQALDYLEQKTEIFDEDLDV